QPLDRFANRLVDRHRDAELIVVTSADAGALELLAQAVDTRARFRSHPGRRFARRALNGKGGVTQRAQQLAEPLFRDPDEIRLAGVQKRAGEFRKLIADSVDSGLQRGPGRRPFGAEGVASSWLHRRTTLRLGRPLRSRRLFQKALQAVQRRVGPREILSAPARLCLPDRQLPGGGGPGPWRPP